MIIPDMECGPGKVCRLFIKRCPETISSGHLGNVLKQLFSSNEYPSGLLPNPLLSFFRFTIPHFLGGGVKIVASVTGVTGLRGSSKIILSTLGNQTIAVFITSNRIWESSVIDSRSDHICGVKL